MCVLLDVQINPFSIAVKVNQTIQFDFAKDDIFHSRTTSR